MTEIRSCKRYLLSNFVEVFLTARKQCCSAQQVKEGPSVGHRFAVQTKQPKSILDSVTYVGFVDFTTTIDDTVVIFRYNSSFLISLLCLLFSFFQYKFRKFITVSRKKFQIKFNNDFVITMYPDLFTSYNFVHFKLYICTYVCI